MFEIFSNWEEEPNPSSSEHRLHDDRILSRSTDNYTPRAHDHVLIVNADSHSISSTIHMIIKCFLYINNLTLIFEINK